MSRVLIVDDEATIAWGLARLAREEGHEALTAASAEEALEILQRTPCDLVFLDVRLPGADGLTVMPALAATPSAPKIAVMTAFGDLKTAVRAYGNGAIEYLVKPFDLEDAAQLIRRALAGSQCRGSSRPAAPASGDGLIGKSPAMQEVFKRIALVAPTEATVVVTGESGTGKELIARAIHRHSRRAQGPLIPIRLGALGSTLVDSELFGHPPDAAGKSHPGLLETASGGTVFLDEIGEVSPDVQAKLLRVIEAQEADTAGGRRARRATCRIVAATSRDLRRLLREGQFREDLFYRLAMFELPLPPLRERGEDITLLAEEFLRGASGHDLHFSRGARERLLAYPWPGNVRQLHNAVRHAVLLARDGQIDVHHLPDDVRRGEPAPPTAGLAAGELSTAVRDWTWQHLRERPQPANLYEEFLNAVEPPLLEAVLERTHHNRAAAADLLGIHRATLRKKLAEDR